MGIKNSVRVKISYAFDPDFHPNVMVLSGKNFVG